MPFARRQVLKGAARSIAATLLGFSSSPLTVARAFAQADALGEAIPFSRSGFLEAARALSAQPFEDRRSAMPQPLQAMGYDAYRAMRPGEGWPMALSPADRFFMDALLGGFVFRQPVDIYLVEGETARRLLFDRSMYVFEPPADQHVPEGELPFSGFRLRTELNNSGVLDEFAVFQGASYFRAVGRGENYGLSARGLAINTGQPSGEEFPYFRAFYIERPAADAQAVVVHALLDSPSTTGAYRITLRPGEATVTDVELTLFPRADIGTIGFAPFSSMFLFDDINRSAFDDYRDAVHDSEGLAIHTGRGERLWRPLSNPARLQVSAFVDTTPNGFGLVQRKRDYAAYEDAEARYETRPTAWVEPIGDWGRGAVVLFEIPSKEETNDNIVTYWEPEHPIVAGEPFSLTYRIHWDALAPSSGAGPKVVNTRHGRNLSGSQELFVIDYEVGDLDVSRASAAVEASAGKIRNLTQYTTPTPGILRVSFELDPDANDAIELRASLAIEGAAPSETWLYRWTG
ncbi:MAG: glucan biosynthesis protein [Acuticoccus sp.]